MNRVQLMGNLGSDPSIHRLDNGTVIANMSIATNERYKDKSGDQQERTEWHRIVLFGRQAEIAEEFLHTGRPVLIEGRLQTRDWEDKDGNKRSTTEVVATNLHLLGGKIEQAELPISDRPVAKSPADDDDLPF